MMTLRGDCEFNSYILREGDAEFGADMNLNSYEHFIIYNRQTT
jgi:hypothetical protein